MADLEQALAAVIAALDYCHVPEDHDAAIDALATVRVEVKRLQHQLEEAMTKESARALIDDASRWQKAYARERDTVAQLRQALNSVQTFLSRDSSARPIIDAVLAGSVPATDTDSEACHICGEPRSETGKIFCSYPHPVSPEQVAGSTAEDTE